MYVSTSQILLSLERLGDLHPFFGFAFFGFKKDNLPISKTKNSGYSNIRESILEPYFKPLKEYDGFFNPFKSPKLWVSSRYDSTSLQRQIADTFSAAFIHKKGGSDWGWSEDYVLTLQSLMETHQSSKISLLDYAVWIYRNDPNIPNGPAASKYLIEKAIHEFNLTGTEISELFYPHHDRALSLSLEQANLGELWDILGWPEGVRDESGIFLEHVNLVNVGPAEDLGYFPRDRLNVITGDNSLGKTFLLDCCWWAATGIWPRHAAEPRRDKRAKVSQISFGTRSSSGRTVMAEAPYNRLEETWQRPESDNQGIGIYAAHDGSLILWDSVGEPGESRDLSNWTNHIIFSRDDIWDGLTWSDRKARQIQISNGLIHDWSSWQRNQRDEEVFQTFIQCLRALSPPDAAPIRPGEPARIAIDSRDFPTIKMPYGDVPIIYASAGMQRILGLAYMIVWQWRRHVERCERAKRPTFDKMVVMIDEVESHLHPRWQRKILPAIIKTIGIVSPGIRAQYHISTHSPLVLASLEANFSLNFDAIDRKSVV